ncbi:MAG: polyphosphate polymerase domain-containing protein [Oscillospiraceae bacterium]|jgi:SPX domain protein involved in polyphosphate accumulation|nr:polyphosphate polymerase domain-containing protein [Oscillospiraceae bacterium]
MPPTLPLRHELKFQINTGEYLVLSRLLDTLLRRDPHGDAFNEYRIRSLYFDTPFDDALYEKLEGVPDRAKYRIRIYNNSDAFIRLECKRKIYDLINKEALTISRELAEQLIARDAGGLLRTGEPLLHQMFAQLTASQLRPVVIVDYVREAYLHPAEEVRVTFDKQLRTALGSIALFDPFVPLIDPFPDTTIILEVKFNRVLPGFIAGVLNGIRGVRQAISKYTICRSFENYTT